MAMTILYAFVGGLPQPRGRCAVRLHRPAHPLQLGGREHGDQSTLRGASREPKPATGLWRDAFARLRKNRLAMVGLIIVILLFVHRHLRAVSSRRTRTTAQDLKAVVAQRGQPLHR